MANTFLQESARVKTIHALYHDGLLSEQAFVAARDLVRPSVAWFSWARRMLLFWGTALVLAGTIFFFAYNWASMDKFLKFGILEAGILGSIILSHKRGLSALSGKMSLVSASVLVGVLLAVYSQIYQTGADAYELFAGWTVLILGWVIVAEFVPLWFLWLILANTSIVLFWMQVAAPSYGISYEYVCLSVALFDGLALALCELGRRLEPLGEEARWLRFLLLVTTLSALSLPTIHFVVEFGAAEASRTLLSLLWCIGAGTTYAWYRYRRQDLLFVAAVVMNGVIILLTIIGRILFDITSDPVGVFFLFALIIIGVVSGAVYWLRHLSAIMDRSAKEMFS